MLVPCLIIIIISHKTKDCSAITTASSSTSTETSSPTFSPTTSTSPAPPEWNASDYQSNSDYYRSLSVGKVFNQEDNLRLDRLSWPRFSPGDGSKVMYLRRQYHMPDVNGSSTTLHWADLSDPLAAKVIQLTRPIWGTNDQQVRIKRK